MKFNLLHPADQLVMIMQRIYQYGMTTTSGGNLSIRDDNGDVWITPSGIDKGSLTRDDMCRVTPDGQVYGPHRPSVELPFHLDIYKRRSDLSAILHAHPPTMVAFSLARRIPDIRLIPDVLQVCGDSFAGQAVGFGGWYSPIALHVEPDSVDDQAGHPVSLRVDQAIGVRFRGNDASPERQGPFDPAPHEVAVRR